MQITVTIASNVFDNLNKLLLELTSSIKLRHRQTAVLSSDACLGFKHNIPKWNRANQRHRNRRSANASDTVRSHSHTLPRGPMPLRPSLRANGIITSHQSLYVISAWGQDRRQ